MKKLIILSMFVSSYAFAMPKVGDYVELGFTFTKGTVVETATVEKELTAYNEASKTFTRKETTHYKGKVYVEEKAVLAEKLVTDAQVISVLEHCDGAVINGKLEFLTTPAGSFKVCTYANTDSEWKGTISMGLVPGGIVKIDVTSNVDGTHQLTLANSYHFGQ